MMANLVGVKPHNAKAIGVYSACCAKDVSTDFVAVVLYDYYTHSYWILKLGLLKTFIPLSLKVYSKGYSSNESSNVSRKSRFFELGK
jgi:hypothetical protein